MWRLQVCLKIFYTDITHVILKNKRLEQFSDINHDIISTVCESNLELHDLVWNIHLGRSNLTTWKDRRVLGASTEQAQSGQPKTRILQLFDEINNCIQRWFLVLLMWIRWMTDLWWKDVDLKLKLNHAVVNWWLLNVGLSHHNWKMLNRFFHVVGLSAAFTAMEHWKCDDTMTTGEFFKLTRFDVIMWSKRKLKTICRRCRCRFNYWQFRNYQE